MENAFKGIKTKNGYIYGVRKDDAGIRGSFTNKFPVYCATFVKEMVYHASNGQATFNYGDKETRIAAFTPIKYGMCWYE